MKATTKSAHVSSFSVVLCLLIVLASTSFAGSATWKSSPATGDWNTATNWTPQTVPNGSSDVATFGFSNVTDVSTSATTIVDGIVFNANASAFTLRPSVGFNMGIVGAGITNNSGQTQQIAVSSSLFFSNAATAGGDVAFLLEVSSAHHAVLSFGDFSTAGQASFTIQETQNAITGVGEIFFFSNSSAAEGTFTIGGGATNNVLGGLVNFDHSSTAGAGIFTANGSAATGAGGGEVRFNNSSSAGTSTLIANGGSGGGGGGSIKFRGHSSGGKARVEVFGNGSLDVSAQTSASAHIGSLEGNGKVFLGSLNLIVDSNNMSTKFSGVIQDNGGSVQGAGGSLTKIGRGTLTFSNGNTYTGGTSINKGTLLVKNTNGSATGTGALQVNAGTLGGTGKIGGTVTVGNGTTAGAILLPGTASKPGTLTINNTLTFNSPGTNKCVLNRATPAASKVSALGVTINPGATFTLFDTTTGTLTPGTVFTVINNTSANPIFGTFSNLASNSTFVSGGTTFKASYTGGTGNDLTLTVQ